MKDSINIHLCTKSDCADVLDEEGARRITALVEEAHPDAVRVWDCDDPGWLRFRCPDHKMREDGGRAAYYLRRI